MFAFDEIMIFKNKNIDVLTIGELLVDMISVDYDDFESSTYNRYFGGSPSNIAINTKRLGINSLVAACVGNDGLGKFLISSLKEAGIVKGYTLRKALELGFAVSAYKLRYAGAVVQLPTLEEIKKIYGL